MRKEDNSSRKTAPHSTSGIDMNFEDLNSEETMKKALEWVSECVQGAMLAGEEYVNFTFSPTENNPIDAIFDFVLNIKDYISDYGFMSWVMLDNKSQRVKMRITFGQGRN